MKEISTTKEKILDRTLYLIGKKGATDIPIRDIAKEVGIHVGAINYHFQSKELMFQQMEEFFISNFNDAYGVLYDDQLDAKEKIIKWANEVMNYTLRYPGILVLMKEKINSKDPNKMGTFLLDASKKDHEKLTQTLKECLNMKENNRVFQFKKAIFISSVVFPVSNQVEITDFSQEIFEDSQVRLDYIEHLLKVLMNN